MPTLLLFVQKADPILREVMPDEQDLKDPELQRIIQDMCYSIQPKQLKAANGAHESAAGMAANQWGIRRRVFLFTPDGTGEGKRMEVMINPSYRPFLRPGETTPKMVAAYEGCFSVPLATGVVNRYEAITVTYYQQNGTPVQKILEGYDARVFQHETDHLDGKLYDGILDHFPGPDCLDRIVFKDKADMENYWVELARAHRKE